jgi:hypothetical protein
LPGTWNGGAQRVTGGIVDHPALEFRAGDFLRLLRNARRHRGQRNELRDGTYCAHQRCGECDESALAAPDPGQNGDHSHHRGQPHLQKLRAGVARFVEQHIDAARKVRRIVGGTGGSQRRTHAASEFHNTREAGRVGSRTSGGGDHQVIAGDFALQVDASGDPAYHRMQREEGFDDALRQQRAIVVTRQMAGFMRDDLLELGGVQSIEKGGGNEDRGAKWPDGHGRRDVDRGGYSQSPCGCDRQQVR